ncbi:hypothetical protein CAI18_22985 (plasmid) [Xanthomonas citri pv. punicae]|uniref:hypothetical protein n=1 Tax=Xanthomonas citri TaxID=346 RepID=UPI000247CEED|nr:hypothetical protein [Xanthomonas citri]QCZ67321.1 hypothetical protein CAI14_23320 [Xanthomonas citri pv. punicae]QCZ71412.1 hypothetical protein CAI17_23315 [Xanthomonas citri pv. punicae]QCZ79591.1 hypothetical protein XapA_23500 [Xanthomonas citri pv. punicae]QCZ83671.1 hypothetical protein XapB_23325 [Xanthomonas citri pv. punicae]QCZ87781.1 hypothetical protein CAI18_22985 [Xanthomonas citri pv. punicae]
MTTSPVTQLFRPTKSVTLQQLLERYEQYRQFAITDTEHQRVLADQARSPFCDGIGTEPTEGGKPDG